jgi:hypothetical protein
MNRQLKAFTITSLSLAVPLVAALAHARTSPPIPRAHPATSANEDCLRYDTTSAGGTTRLGLRNGCAASVTFQMPLAIDAPQAYTVLVRLRDTGAGALTCTTRVRDAFGNFVAGGGDDPDSNTTLDGDEELFITTDPVPAGGTLVLNCVMSGGAANLVKIFGVDWF